MKLILSSYDFYNPDSRKVIHENLPKPIGECKTLFIPTGSVTPELIEKLCEFGFTQENLIFFNHEKSENYAELDIDMIYVSGGNTFSTLDKIQKCGFDKHIIDYIKSGVIYVGGSAGAHIVTQNIEHVTKYDENNVGLTDFSGLGLFNGILICHYTYHRREHLDKLISQGKYNVEYLTDSDSIVIDQ